jgi:predicted DNA-binding transcriptional regulator AlpA
MPRKPTTRGAKSRAEPTTKPQAPRRKKSAKAPGQTQGDGQAEELKKIPAALRNFDDLPDSAGVRQPVVEGLYSCSGSTVWRRVAAGLIPKPEKWGGTTVWNVGKLRESLQGGAK